MNTIRKDDIVNVKSFSEFKIYINKFLAKQSKKRINAKKIINLSIGKYDKLNIEQLQNYFQELTKKKIKFTDSNLKNLTGEALEKAINKNIYDKFYEKVHFNNTRNQKSRFRNYPSMKNNHIKNFFAKLTNYQLLTRDEEIKYAKMKMSDDPEIRKMGIDKLIKHNLKLVVAVARNYSNKKVELFDLIQEGSVGMLKAIEKFDYQLGYKFSTYATWWIRQAIVRAISDQSRTVRIPIHMIENINKIKKAERYLIQKLKRTPTDEEIAQRINLPYITKEKVGLIKRLANDPISLEKPIGSEENTSFMSFVSDKKIKSPEEIACENDLKFKIEELLEKQTTAKEEKIIRLRFGLKPLKLSTILRIEKETNHPLYLQLIKKIHGYRLHYETLITDIVKLDNPLINEFINKYSVPNSYQDIAKELEIDTQQIRQLESKVIRKIKAQNYSSTVKEIQKIFYSA